MENTLIPSEGQHLFNNTRDKNWTGPEDEGSGFDRTDLVPVTMIWSVIPPFLIAFGSIGNALIIAVFVRSFSTSGMLFCALAVSDLIGLYLGLFPVWIEHVSGINHHQSGTFLCKVLPWIKSSVLDYSAWILVAVTTERVIATCFPHRSKTICTRRFAVRYLVASGLTLMCVNSHFLYGFEYTEIDVPGEGILFYCHETPASYTHFYSRVWPWIDVSVFCLIPFTVICVGNCVILSRVRNSYQKFVRNRSMAVASTITSMPSTRTIGRRRISNLTVKLLLINSAFFISTFPVSVFMIFSEQYFNDYQNIATIETWWVFVYNFMYLNNTFNVVFYCLSGSKFRHGVLALFRKSRRFCFNSSSLSNRARQSGSNRSG